jgi:alanine racemase
MFMNLFRRKYQHLNKIFVIELALRHNHQTLQNFHPEAKIVPVLKSNAYGHGLTLVAPIFDDLNPTFLTVDSLYEAYELVKLKVKSQILILGYTHPDNFSVKRLPFHITVFDLEVARSLNIYQRNCKVHIFVDTGMCREGIPLNELRNFIQEIKKMTNLEIVGLASHFADADNPSDDSFAQKQLANYKKALQILEEEGITPQYRHISASAGAFKIKDGTCNMIRAGLASYGINPLETSDLSHNQLSLKPALLFTSTLAQIKTVSNGDRIGYNGTFIVKESMKIGLLPLGYYEGVDRRLSNKGSVLINGTVCPILGRVSMNMTTVDLSDVKNPKVGDEVIIYSDNQSDVNSLINSAKTAGSIPYELVVHLAESVRREVI